MFNEQHKKILGFLLSLIPLGGCMSTYSFDAVEAPRVVFKDEATAVGLIEAKEMGNPLNPTPPEVPYRGLQDAIGSRMDVKTFDSRSQQHEIRWSKKPDFFDKVDALFTGTPTKAPEPFLIFGPNAKVEPPLLVSLHYVSADKSLRAYMMLWTRTGVLLERNWVSANITNMGSMALNIGNTEVLSQTRGITGHPYERSDEGWDAQSMAPSERTQQLLHMLRHSYGAMLYPYLSHKKRAQIIFIEQPTSIPEGMELTKQNRFPDAYAAFMKVAETNPKHHGALANAAQLKWALGDSKTAAELMKKANAISSSGLTKGLQEQYEREAAGSKVIDANAPPPPPPPPAE